MAWLPIVAAIAGAGGALVSASAASQQAKAQQNMANYNAQVATNNATAVRQQAGANEEAQRRQAAVQLGRERAGIVQSGQGLDGTGADIYRQSTGNAELDALNTRYMGELKGQGLDSESTLQRTAATQYGNNASSALIGGFLNAGAAGLSGYGGVMQWQKRLPLGGS
jgi:mannitol-specific phosphotransferase system IIBC component